MCLGAMRRYLCAKGLVWRGESMLFSSPAMCAPVIELKLSDLVAISSANRAILPPFSHLIFSMRL